MEKGFATLLVNATHLAIYRDEERPISTATWSLPHKVVDVGCTSGGNDLMHGDLSAVVALGDVGGDAVVEEGGLLGDDSQLLAEPAEI